MKAKILLVEDDLEVANLEEYLLQREGHDVIMATNGIKALELLREHALDLVVLDIMLPGLDGYEFCRKARKMAKSKFLPILIVSALMETDHKVRGLDEGANDYLAKPFEPIEFLARVRALLRQSSETNQQWASPLRVGPFYIDPSERLVQVHQQTVLDLTAKEFDLLHELARNNPKVLSKEHLLKAVFGRDVSKKTNTLYVHVQRLRQKLPEELAKKIETVEGKGYRFVTFETEPDPPIQSPTASP